VVDRGGGRRGERNADRAPDQGRGGRETARNMPTIAVNMISETTFGFVSAK
jgi:hypothetical protein